MILFLFKISTPLINSNKGKYNDSKSMFFKFWRDIGGPPNFLNNNRYFFLPL